MVFGLLLVLLASSCSRATQKQPAHVALRELDLSGLTNPLLPPVGNNADGRPHDLGIRMDVGDVLDREGRVVGFELSPFVDWEPPPDERARFGPYEARVRHGLDFVLLKNGASVFEYDAAILRMSSSRAVADEGGAIPGPDPGEDIDGDGVPDVLLYEYSGGAHCCFTVKHISCSDPPVVRSSMDTQHSHAHYQDLDGDGLCEVTYHDWSYAYWHTSFGGSPAPRIVLHIAGGYRLAPELMRLQGPNATELPRLTRRWQEELAVSHALSDRADRGEELSEEEQGRIHHWGWFNDEARIPPEIWGTMLDLIYSDRVREAVAFAHEVWPPGRRGVEDFIVDVLDKVLSSPDAASLPWIGQVRDAARSARKRAGPDVALPRLPNPFTAQTGSAVAKAGTAVARMPLGGPEDRCVRRLQEIMLQADALAVETMLAYLSASDTEWPDAAADAKSPAYEIELLLQQARTAPTPQPCADLADAADRCLRSAAEFYRNLSDRSFERASRSLARARESCGRYQRLLAAVRVEPAIPPERASAFLAAMDEAVSATISERDRELVDRPEDAHFNADLASPAEVFAYGNRRVPALGKLWAVMHSATYRRDWATAFDIWRTEMQSGFFGQSNWSLIPNAEYNTVRFTLVARLRAHLDHHPDDTEARIQLDDLLTLPNIRRGGLFGNSNGMPPSPGGDSP